VGAALLVFVCLALEVREIREGLKGWALRDKGILGIVARRGKEK
jgi:hypothetical protein